MFERETKREKNLEQRERELRKRQSQAATDKEAATGEKVDTRLHTVLTRRRQRERR
jgi:hypothetical protein